MITIEKLKVYKMYEGDIDGWARSGRRQEKAIMEDSDWFMISGFIQDLSLIKNGLAAESFSAGVTKSLIENCDGEETMGQLKALAGGT